MKNEFELEAVDFDPFAEGELSYTAPSTEAQKEIWASVQMGDAANRAFNESITLSLRGPVDFSALKRAFQRFVEQHDALRTTISADGNTLCIAPSRNIDLPIADLTSGDQASREAHLSALAAKAVETRFDLEKGPLYRIKALKFSENEFYVIFTAHHIIFDGWSAGVLMEALGELYSNFCQGLTPPFNEGYQFSEYAVYKEKNIKSDTNAKVENYWIDQFSSDIPILEFPTDYLRPPLRTFNSRRIDWVLDEALVAGLKRIGINAGSSFFMTLFAGFAVFLNRMTHQRDLVVGVPAAGQSIVGQDKLVGHCINLLPIRVQVDEDLTFTDLLKPIRAKVLDAFEHQEYTFGSLISKLSIPRDPSRIPLVSVLFNVDQELSDSELGFKDLDVSFTTNPRAYENFELFINTVESAGRLIIECQYNTDLYKSATIKRRLEAFEILLAGIIENPRQLISQLPLLPENERHQVLVEWNRTEREYPLNRCIHHFFEDQVKKWPEKTAVFDGIDAINYSTLDAKANQLAAYLRKLGVGPNVLVGIFLERSTDMLACLLAVLKAGGGYVPLDPAFPRNRLEFMLDDADVKIVLTQKRLKTELRKSNTHFICVDEAGSEIYDTAVTLPEAEDRLASDNLAYVIYTSGSTGKPKGVQVSHRTVVNFLLSMKEKPGFTENDVMPAVTTLSFDIAVLELYLPILCGGKTVIVDRDTATDGNRLMEMINNQNATVMQATPTTWRLLINAGWKGNDNFKALCGGEAMPKDLAVKLLDRVSKVWNMYGPTETTVWSTCHKIESSVGPVLVGKPIANTEIYILDRKMQPVPIGVTGELFIGGAGVTKGYLNRPRLNDANFISNPFKNDGLSRIYNTGDEARYLPDGNIEVLGRRDFQVKVHGYRIELGEIETLLGEHEALEQVAVSVHQSSEDIRLIAYYTVKSGKTTNTTALRDHLLSKLPEYMIPSIFMRVEKMSLTPNNKIDRKSLPAPDYKRPALEQAYVPPRNQIEARLAEIWQKILKLDQIGIYDRFFEIGGTSLSGAQVISEMRQAFNKPIQVIMLFQYPTIESLARFLTSEKKSEKKRISKEILERGRLRRASFAKRRRET